jgi:threo-3-hydroxy-L-aspartate ammonia-lyase
VLSLEDIRAAADRLEGVAHRTPVLTSRSLDEQLGSRLFLKAEGLQRIGAFKFRGAYNAVSTLDRAALQRGVCAASSGNHAQALALSARLCETRAVILMPRDAPEQKRSATEAYGAEVLAYDRYSDDREGLTRELAQERGLTIIHPYDNEFVMAGAGTVGLELVTEIPDLDVVLVPVGGGGLISGCATAIKGVSPATRVVGVEPLASDDVTRSLAAGARQEVEVGRTIADGQQLSTPGDLTWPVISARVDDAVAVSDEQIVAAMRLLFERMKVVAEPSGACALAALLSGVVRFEGQRVGVVLSGANVDARRFGELVGSGAG